MATMPNGMTTGSGDVQEWPEDDSSADDIATAIIKRVCEIDKHGPSPDDQPDLLRVTVDELRFIITSELNPD